jgi:hypothetical protein
MGLEHSILDSEPRITLAHNDCWHVDLFPRQQIVWATRTSVPFASREHADAIYLPLHESFDALAREEHALLLDARLAPARNDPQYESSYAAHRARMAAGFRRTAVMMRTQVGALQARRLVAADQLTMLVFTELDAALAWLQGSAPPVAARRPGA